MNEVHSPLNTKMNRRADFFLFKKDEIKDRRIFAYYDILILRPLLCFHGKNGVFLFCFLFFIKFIHFSDFKLLFFYCFIAFNYIYAKKPKFNVNEIKKKNQKCLTP